MIKPRFDSCDLMQLEHLFDGQQTAPSAELSTHLETCTRCQQRLESMAADQDWWSDVSEFLPNEGYTHEAIQPTRGQSDAASSSPATHETSILEPSDRVDALGRLGSYDILEVIGRGGMGIVFKGYEPALNRYVAVKVLAPHLADSAAARKRFQREAEAAAAVIHEHVIPIHAIDATADGMPYLVMPLVLSGSLQRRLDRQGPFELRDILRIGLQAAAGLAAAHAQGLVHRDIKPANILLDGGTSRVLLTDFGLARAADDASLTRSGVIAGTPHYMSPEQVLADPIDARADLFSLGGVLFTLATGHPPFRAEITMAVLRRICEDEPRSVREINPDLPIWFEAIVGKLLEKQADDRFQTATEVCELLSGCLAHLQQPCVIPLPEEVPHLIQPSHLKRGLVWGGVTLAVISVLVASSWFAFSSFWPAAQTEPAGTNVAVPERKTEPAEVLPIDYPPEETVWDDSMQEEIITIRTQLDRWTEIHSLSPASATSIDSLIDLSDQIQRLEQQAEVNTDK